MTRPALRWTVCGLLASLLSFSAVPSPAQEKKDPPKVTQAKADPSAERASGVIIKAEPIAGGGGVRLTINTAAVWRDWARDQGVSDPNISPRKAAERGANSVATKGEPQTKDTLVVVKLSPGSKLETRFRMMDDETSKGSSTPDAAAAARSREASGGSRTQAAKPTQYKASDLKPGLFIEADFRRAGGENLVSTVAVVRPINESAVTAKPSGK